jgi:hypothetical protein
VNLGKHITERLVLPFLAVGVIEWRNENATDRHDFTLVRFIVIVTDSPSTVTTSSTKPILAYVCLAVVLLLNTVSQHVSPKLST